MTPHSIYFQLLSELGLVGVFCWMGFLVATFRELRELRGVRLEQGFRLVLTRDPDPETFRRMSGNIRFLRNFSACLAIGITGYLVSGGFLSVLFYPGLALFAALAQGSGRVWRTELLVASMQARIQEGSGSEAGGRPAHVPGEGGHRSIGHPALRGDPGFGSLAMGRAEP